MDKETEYQAKIFKDGKDADYLTNPYPVEIEEKIVTSNTVLDLQLAPSGGTGIILSKK